MVTPNPAPTMAKAVESAGATIINTGIGWHEARIPTTGTLTARLDELR